VPDLLGLSSAEHARESSCAGHLRSPFDAWLESSVRFPRPQGPTAIDRLGEGVCRDDDADLRKAQRTEATTMRRSPGGGSGVNQ